MYAGIIFLCLHWACQRCNKGNVVQPFCKFPERYKIVAASFMLLFSTVTSSWQLDEVTCWITCLFVTSWLPHVNWKAQLIWLQCTISTTTGENITQWGLYGFCCTCAPNVKVELYCIEKKSYGPELNKMTYFLTNHT